MNEILDSIISLFYELKYSPVINKRRNFRKMINLYKELTGDESLAYKAYVINEISRLKVKSYSAGIPYYAVFEKHNDITKVFVLDEQIQFMYRLEDFTCVDNSFYIKLN